MKMAKLCFFHLFIIINCLKYGNCGQSKCYHCFKIVSEILQVSKYLHLTGQVLVSTEWFQYFDNRNLYETLPNFEDEMPKIVYDKIENTQNSPRFNTSCKSSAILHRYTSSKFVHLHHSSSSLGSLEFPQKTSAWRHLYLPFKYGTLKYKFGSTNLITWNNFLKKDLFLLTVNLITITNDDYVSTMLFARHVIWIGCHNFSTILHPKRSEEPKLAENSTLLSLGHACVYSHQRDAALVSGSTMCKKIMSLHILIDGYKCVAGYGCNKNTCNTTGLSQGSASVEKRSDGLSRKGLLYSSLVFIAKKSPTNVTNVWGPFTVASWIGILAAYTVTAIVFGVIKIVTMNNLDNSWYDCIINQLLNLVGDDKISHMDVGQVNSTTVGIVWDENKNVINCDSKYWKEANHRKSCVVTRQISVRSLTIPSENSLRGTQASAVCLRNDGHHPHNRGKMSKSILYGTIRVVSFILLAMYEGKLYNTITFPKSKLVASFDELVSNEKYFIKLTNEAAKHENITEQIKGNISISNGGIMFRNRSNNKIVESVNILDCVSWVERDIGPDPNHACVGYEFELRNLHKAQKSDKILVKSKQKLLRFGSAASRIRRRGFTLFPGGFQISKWILESGILQLWSIVENAFMESLVNPNWSDPFKVFTIRDYLGLFVVYSLLLILATIMFTLEHAIVLGKKFMKHTLVRKMWERIVKHANYLKSCFSLKHCMPFWLNLQLCLRTVFVKWKGRKYIRSLSSLNISKV